MGRIHLLCNELQSYITRFSLNKSLNIRYGTQPGEKIDIFPTDHPNAPVLIFIHGGYFRALDKRQYSYIAKPLVQPGCTVVLINYDLVPKVNIKEIIEQSIQAYLWVYKNISR